MFGYEDPCDATSNARTGTDFETSTGLLIDAPDPSTALDWGREVSRAFVIWRFQQETRVAPDWRADTFALCLEPDAGGAWVAFSNAPVVEVGQMPPFEHPLPYPP